MDHDRAKDLLRQQIERTHALEKQEHFSPDWKQWIRDTEVILEKTFGKGTRHVKDFQSISYSLGAYVLGGTPQWEFDRAYCRGLETARKILGSMIVEIDEFGASEVAHGASTRITLETIIDRFHVVARQLRSRHGGRPTLEVEDEHDAQDLFHALLHTISDDIRREEWTPSYAGGSARVDFLLKQEQIVVELKKTRKNLTAREIGDELLIDIGRYRVHADCRSLLCFVYDPEGRIGNPTGLERDLSGQHNGLPVTVIVGPKGR